MFSVFYFINFNEYDYDLLKKHKFLPPIRFIPFVNPNEAIAEG